MAAAAAVVGVTGHGQIENQLSSAQLSFGGMSRCLARLASVSAWSHGTTARADVNWKGLVLELHAVGGISY